MEFTERLKKETLESHKSIESSKALSNLFSRNFTLETYRDLLCKFYGYYSALETRLFSNIPDKVKPIFSNKSKLLYLSADLTNLGVSKQQQHTLPQCLNIPSTDKIEYKIGIIYVLEGATMGGLVIRQHLLKHFSQYQVEKTTHFFNPYEKNTAKNWTTFKALLSQWYTQAALEKDADSIANEAITSANETFHSLQTWLNDTSQ